MAVLVAVPVTVLVNVGVLTLVFVPVGNGVLVRVAVGLAVLVTVGVAVLVKVGVSAAVFVFVGTTVLVLVAVSVTVRVNVEVFAAVLVGLGSGVLVPVAVLVAVLEIISVGVLVAVTIGVRVDVSAGGRHPTAAIVFCAAGAFKSTTSSTHSSKLYGAPVCPCVCHCMAFTAERAIAFVTSVLPQPSCENKTLEKSTDIFCHDVVAVKTKPYMSSSSRLLNAAGEFIFSLKDLDSLLLHQKVRPVAELIFTGLWGSFSGNPSPANPY